MNKYNNLYDQPDTSYGGAYGGNGYQPDTEMQPLTGTYQNGGRSDPNAILNECTQVSGELSNLERRLDDIRKEQRRYVDDPSNSQMIENMSADLMSQYSALTEQVRRLKGRLDANSPRNKGQIGKVDRDLKRAINEYQRVEADFRRQLQESQARQYKIVNPNATEEEIERVTADNPNQQIFQQALMQGNRAGVARSTLDAVRSRHEELQRIEKSMTELAQLFQDLDAIVYEQEPMVQRIEEQSEQVHDDMVKGNDHLVAGVKSARAAKKKKWICLGISVLLIIIIICAVLGYLAANCRLGNCKTTTT